MNDEHIDSHHSPANNIQPNSSAQSQQLTWINHCGLFEGTLSLLLFVMALSSPHTVKLAYLPIVMGLGMGLALGGIRFGYSFGKLAGWFVFVGMGLLILALALQEVYNRLLTLF